MPANRRLIQTSLGQSLRYVGHKATSDAQGEHLDIMMENEKFGFSAVLHFLLAPHASMFRVWADVTNTAETPMVLEAVTSFVGCFGVSQTVAEDADAAGNALQGDFDSWKLYESSNDWLAESRWSVKPIREVCPYLNNAMAERDPNGAHCVISEGTFSTGRNVPMGMVSSDKLGLTWIFEVENNGAWRWETGDYGTDGYFALSGPDWRDHGWSVSLDRSETFTTVPASVALAPNSDAAVAALTCYRRAIHDKAADTAPDKLIFNDYMNTINGDPTTAKLLPLIDAAAEVGMEVFCVDCGWYDDTGDWWPSIGEWMPSKTRFPNGLEEVTDHIHKRGMVAGLWMEPESVGIDSPVAKQLPDGAFFLHDGQRCVEQRRYQLDYRNPLVIEHMNKKVDYLIEHFGIGYFKFDYNIMPGPGTDYHADSPGDGLLGHNRTYLDWIHGLFVRHPGLIIETCSSGGMRADTAQASHFQLISTSDQQDYRLYPAIAAAAPMTMLPEQAGNWAYPEKSMNDEQFVFSLANSMLGHFFLSGYINQFSERQKAMVEDAVKVYSTEVRPRIVSSVPFWPLGLPGWKDDVVSLGLAQGQTLLIDLWDRRSASGNAKLSLPAAEGHDIDVQIIFPTLLDSEDWHFSWNKEDGILGVDMPKDMYAARVLRVQIK
ncbi:alpha-galactosidase [Bifidobacterium sp. ESL0690]|uniref:glycoside hydrolase family 36 protein n=1 Tax=Bifidobacterium sp. ESL0690 TaxID=2983214 RepID=UPI0023F9AE21|nr:glycoside hydrolase family 36 protein [Bifidobacterium sp. ESL0690]WEV46069.1 alpha-galactosidase [Bifidobacterium sp. ESL0690]